MPGQPVILDTFGGLVSVARPEDIPEGASPRNNDVDFVVGRFIQRAGEQSVYSYGGADFGPNGGGAASDINTVGNPWINPNNILVNDGTFTSVTVPSAPASFVATSVSVTQPAGGTWINLPNMIGTGPADAFTSVATSLTPTVATVTIKAAIPATAVVMGLVVKFTAFGGNPSFLPAIQFDFGGTFKAQTVTTTSMSYTLGSSTDTWGEAFTGADLIAGIPLFVTPQSGGSFNTLFAYGVQVTVYYSEFSSDALAVQDFGFSVPSTFNILGFTATVTGYGLGATLFAQLMKSGVPVGGLHSVSLPATSSPFTLGGVSDLWGDTWDFTDVDSTTFGIRVWAFSTSVVTVALDYLSITISGSDSFTNFNGIVSANIEAIDQTTLALDSSGIVWAEDVTNTPNVLNRESLIPTVVPGSYMKGLDANGIAYMAYSDLSQGTSQPMQFNGQWADRITQVGPGAAPVFTPQVAQGVSYNISTITQPPANSDDTDPGHISVLLWSAGPGTTTPGNVITVYYSPSFGAPAAEDMVLDAAFNAGQVVIVYISGAPFGNGVYQVTSIGNNLPPGVAHGRWYFTVQAATSNYQNVVEATGQYQMSVATLTTTTPVPGLEVGNQITVTGSTPTDWNAVWTITQTLNSGAMTITATSVTTSVATYNYSVISGAAPAAGQRVNVTGTLNADGALNGPNLLIASSTGGSTGTFTVAVSVPNAATVSETGQATTAGTIFDFDPGAALVGTNTSPIFGNGTGGSLTFAANTSTFITPGVKQGSVFFITRNGAVTKPANPVTFTIPSNTQAIAATQIPIGPPNVIARGITFTESGQNEVPGASFYTYDEPVNFTVSGIQYTATALIVPDNVTTTANFSFPDSVLLASDEIDVQGNNYFNLIEIGSPAWIAQYADRMMYGLCQTKVQNFINLSFDGGYLPAVNPMPLGWDSTGNITDLTQGLVVSPDFGDTFQVLNTGGSTITNAYLIYQSSYQDFYGVNILQPNTAYSVRLKARALNANGQTITLAMVPFATGAFGDTIGSVTFTVNEGGFTIQTAPIMTAQATILPTLQLAVQIASLGAGDGFQIDRIEIFPTDHPVDTTTIWTSYVGNFEAVDGVTGQLGCGSDNSQPAQGAYQILENLFIEKTASRCVTQDSPNYEPNQWNVPLSSQGSGSVGPNAFYSEEEFSISASRPGLFLFDGGKPMPISRELQSTGTQSSIWNTINWAAGKSIWLRYSTEKRQLFVGVPMITPNFWLPKAEVSTPTEPNVILMCNFTGCPTAEELASSTPVHTTMFGDLKALDMRRKWSIWQIVCPVAEFVTRQDGLTAPLFLCNGINSSKIYQLVDGAPVSGQNTDDGSPINWSYFTFGFVKGKQGQQVPGLGAIRKVWYYFTATMEGIGQVARKFYSNSVGALPQNTYTAPPATLSYPAQNDQECVLEIGGQRLFIEFSAVGTGGYAEVGPVMLDGEMDKNSPHRGVSA